TSWRAKRKIWPAPALKMGKSGLVVGGSDDWALAAPAHISSRDIQVTVFMILYSFQFEWLRSRARRNVPLGHAHQVAVQFHIARGGAGGVGSVDLRVNAAGARICIDS